MAPAKRNQRHLTTTSQTWSVLQRPPRLALYRTAGAHESTLLHQQEKEARGGTFAGTRYVEGTYDSRWLQMEGTPPDTTEHTTGHDKGFSAQAVLCVVCVLAVWDSSTANTAFWLVALKPHRRAAVCCCPVELCGGRHSAVTGTRVAPQRASSTPGSTRPGDCCEAWV